MNGSFVAFALAIATLCSASPALAADASVSAARPYHFAAEIKPLSLLFNAIPGSRAFSGGLEAPVTDHLALFGNVSYLNLHLPSSAVKESTTKEDGKTVVKTAQSTTFQGGARYYGHVASDSWYAGGSFGTGTSNVQWKHDNESLEDKSTLFTSGIEGGYRWLWNSGFMVRVGAQLTASNLRERNISAAATKAEPSIQARQDVEKEGQQSENQIATGFDVGIGWVF